MKKKFKKVIIRIAVLAFAFVFFVWWCSFFGWFTAILLALLALFVWEMTQKSCVSADGKTYDKNMILWTVEHTDKVNPEDNFRIIVPYIHTVPEALDLVNKYGNLSRLYSDVMFKTYGDSFPFEIEEDVINLEQSNLIYYLTTSGHRWSKEAQKLMKEKHPLPYEHNIQQIKDAFSYLLKHKFGLWNDAEKYGSYSMDLFKNLGYVEKIGNTYYKLLEKGETMAAFYLNDK